MTFTTIIVKFICEKKVTLNDFDSIIFIFKLNLLPVLIKRFSEYLDFLV